MIMIISKVLVKTYLIFEISALRKGSNNYSRALPMKTNTLRSLNQPFKEFYQMQSTSYPGPTL